MPKWLSIVIVIIVAFAIAGFIERRRATAMDAWRRARGFTEIEPFVPTERGPVQALASAVTGRDPNSLHWASVITGNKITLAEISYTPAGRKTSVWFTLAVWPETTTGRPLSGAFVSLDGYAGWMTEGLPTPERAEELLAQIGARTGFD